jgi:ubiquinone/menaquinone biosynthesis C-methylase UbiE
MLELACGRGRHSEVVARMAGRLIIMDVLEENIAACRKRLAVYENIEYFKNNGFNFHPLMDESVTSIFCYDAMVHFTPDIVRSYLKDTARVLKPGGMALYHHSNYAGPELEHYGLHPHARNCMTQLQFAELASECGLSIVESTLISWGGVPDLDRLTLVKK